MGNHRVLLYFTLFFIIYMIWAQWQIEYGPQPVPAVVQEKAVDGVIKEAVPGADLSAIDGQATPMIAENTAPVSDRINIVTDVLDVVIDTKGGDIVRVVLRDYSVTAGDPEDQLVLLTDENVNYHVAQSGLVSKSKGTAPSHNTIYQIFYGTSSYSTTFFTMWSKNFGKLFNCSKELTTTLPLLNKRGFLQTQNDT